MRFNGVPRLRLRCLAVKQWLLLLALVLIIMSTMTAYQISMMRTRRRDDITQINIEDWHKNPYVKCYGHFEGYGHELAWLKQARFDKFRKVFSIPCEEEILKYEFMSEKEGTVLDKWMQELETYSYAEALQSRDKAKVRTRTTFAVMRYEAHNIYHTMCEWFNVFIICDLFHLDPKEVDILFMDDRPKSLLDETWDILFADILRYSNVTENVIFSDLIWNAIGYESPLNFHNVKSIPFIDEFSDYFLKRFGIDKRKPLDCNHLNVTIIWRRDYLSHPERKQETGGLIHRKFQNEKEILEEIQTIFKGHKINEIILEEMTMRQQLKTITDTDILFGMHGAGMAHVLFLPKHAGVFETFPDYWGYLRHFKAFSRWRGLRYLSWKNKSPDNEYPNYYTKIPIEVINYHMTKLKHDLCPK